MTTIGEKHLALIVKGEDAEKDQRDKALYEIHYRVPRGLITPLVATHFMHVRKSTEDRYFEFAVDLVNTHFKKMNLKVSQEKEADWSRLLTAKDLPVWLDRKTKEKLDKDPKTLPDILQGIVRIVSKITAAYEQVLAENVALFVFGASGQILFLVARIVTNENGHSTALSVAFARFRAEFEKYFEDQLRVVYQTLDSRGPLEAAFRVDEVGGILRELEKKRKPDDDRLSRLYDDFRHFAFRSDASVNSDWKHFEYYLRWLRLPQAWNYTFVESLVTSNIDRSGLTPTLNGDYPPLITKLILSAAVSASVLNAKTLPPWPDEHKFPGEYGAGAHYLMLPIAALIAFSVASPHSLGLIEKDKDAEASKEAGSQAILQKVQAMRAPTEEDAGRAAVVYEAIRKNGLRISRAMEILSACIEILGVPTIELALKKHIIEREVTETIRTFLQDPEPSEISRRIIRYVADTDHNPLGRGVYEFIGSVVGRALRSRERRKQAAIESLLASLGKLIEAFWDCTFAVSIEPSLKEVAEDYVCSAIVDRRCIYFSNFVPFGKEKFTRTIFIDIDMTPFQRGRVLQRLCDILTYRSIPTSDLDRVRAAVEALNELNQQLDAVQMTLASIDGSKPGLLSNELAKTVSISARAARMNAFLSYGVAGRWFASDSCFKEIVERCEDLREERIAGYAQLTDFVERRLAHVMRTVERMYMHHQTVSQRVTELLDRIRTQLGAWQSDQMLDVLAGLKTAADAMKDGAKDIRGSLAQLVSLQRVAEFILLLGGTYYLYAMLHALSELQPFDDYIEAHAPWSEYVPLAAAVSVTLAFGLRHLWKKFGKKKRITAV